MAKFVLTITREDGMTSVVGPITDAILCYGMLEMAKDIIREHNKDKGSRIEFPIVNLPFPPQPGPGGGGRG